MVMLGGLILENPDNAARFPEAVELFRRAAALGNTDAEYNLGVCLRRGLGVRPNAKAAALKYRAAAEKNHLSAQLALGDVLAETAATEAEWLDAAHWYQLAADSGNATAQTRLADIRKNRLRSGVSEGATSAAS
jgi:TPR repeat protein